MRIFLIQWGGGYQELFDVAKELEQKSHEVIYWMSDKKFFSELARAFPKTIFHDWRDAVNGVPAESVDNVDFQPPSAELIGKLYSEEPFIMNMITKHHIDLTMSERRHFYYHLLRYWAGIFGRYTPEAVIFPVTPHTAPDFIVYSLAKLFNIKTLMFYATEVSDRLILMEDFRVGSAALKQAAEKSKNKKIVLEELSEDLRFYYEERIGSKYVMPLSLRLFRKNFGGFNFFIKKWRALIDMVRGLTLPETFLNYALRLMGDNLKKEYLRFAEPPDFSEKFVYLPLQYQPEATTSPLGGIFVDQVFMAEAVSASLPPGWLIYIKEHPSQWRRHTTKFSEHRYRSYYERLSGLKNARIVPMETSTSDLVSNAQAVAVPTGTAGWEAALKLKPTIAFGYPWYKYCPSVFAVDSVESCRAAIEKIQSGFCPTEAQIIGFLAALDQSSIHGYLEAHTKQLSSISPEEATQNIANALLEKLKV